MKKILLSASCVVALLIGLNSCSNTNGNNVAQQTEHHDHDGHDHSAHDHSGHDHAAHSHDNAPEANAPTQEQINELSQAAPAQTIPAFTFYKVKSGVAFTNADIPTGKKTAFILFDPSCSHCQHEAAALGKNYSKLKDVNIYFISMNDPALQASFLETFAKELVGKPNIEVLYDRNQDFIQKFHVPKQFPANYVYGKDLKLQTSWDGERDINKIIEAYTK